MKRLSALALLLITLLCCGCGKNEDKECKTIVLSVFDRNGSCFLYDSSAVDNPIDDDMILRLFSYRDLPDAWSSVSDAALLLSKNFDGFEVLLLRCRHPSEKPRVVSLLRRRLSLLQSADVRRYMGEDYYLFLSSAGVYEIGDYLCLLSTEDNDAFLEKLKKEIGSR